MTNISAPRRVLRHLLGVGRDSPSVPSMVSGYSTTRRVIAGLLGVRLPEHPATVKLLASIRPQNDRQPVLVSGLYPLFACDISSFGGPARSDHVSRQQRVALYRALQVSFDASGISFNAVYFEDRGDGAFIAVPSVVDTSVLITAVFDQLQTEIRRYNEVASQVARLQLRVAVHVGEIASDTHGVVGSGLNPLFRMLDAPLFKAASRQSDAGVVLIVSGRVYENDVQSGPGLIDSSDYRQITFQDKETEATAWIRVPGAFPDLPLSAETASGESFELVERMLDIPLMRSEHGREQLVAMLPPEIAGFIPRSAEARMDLYAIIRTCLDYSGGLAQLAQGFRELIGDWRAVQQVEESMIRPTARLTVREREIAQLVATGLSNRQIGDQLNLSPRTVENHLARIYAKLGVASRTELSTLKSDTSR